MTQRTNKTLQEIADQIQVTRFLDEREFLARVYELAKERIADYSYLLFARDLGFSATNVVRLMIVGKRPLTIKSAEKIAKGLGLVGAERRYWLVLAEYSRERLPAKRESLFQDLLALKSKSTPGSLTKEQLQYFSKWYNPVIRELISVGDFDGTADWVQDRLVFPLRLEEIKKSLELLTRIGFIRKNKVTGKYERTNDRVTTDREVDSLAIVSYHQQMMEMGKSSMTTVSEEERDIRAVTVGLPAAAVPALKAKIDGWIQEILAYEDDERKNDAVYQPERRG